MTWDGNSGGPSLERALTRTEAEADAALKAVKAANKSLKQAKSAAAVGNLRDVRTAMATADTAVAALQQQVARLQRSWDFDEDAYFASGAFQREVLETARSMDVRIYEQDDRLYCYPSLIRVLPNDRAVQVDRARERRVRPSVLVSHLRDVQSRPARFKSDAFLETLHSAYATLDARRGKDKGRGAAERLLDIYALLTLLPGQAKEYSVQEFARDVYLLDKSGTTTTRKKLTVSFPASTGTKAASGTISVVTESGQEKTYYAIAFVGPDPA